MKKKILTTLLIVALSMLVGFVTFVVFGSKAAMEDLDEEFRYLRQLAELDQRYLTNIVTRPSLLVSGRFVFVREFPGKTTATNFISLEFTNHQFALTRSSNAHRIGMADTLVQDANVVSWRDEGIMYESDAYHVGLIDGETISGRVYGWNLGKEAVGFWRIYPQSRNLQSNDGIEANSR